MSGYEWWEFYTGGVPTGGPAPKVEQPTTKARVVDWGEGEMDVRQYNAREFLIGGKAGYHVAGGEVRRFDIEEAPVIGIMGDIGSGKTSLATILEGVGFRELSFAKPLKDMCIELFGLKHRHCYGTQADKDEPLHHLGPVPERLKILGMPWRERVGKTWTGRWVMEYAGTEFGRTIYGDVWIDAAFTALSRQFLLGDIDATHLLENRYVASDVRFRNEGAAIRRRSGQLWRIGIMDEDGREKVGDRGKTGHQSDEEWRTITPDVHFLAQRGSLDALEFEVLKVLSLAGL